MTLLDNIFEVIYRLKNILHLTSSKPQELEVCKCGKPGKHGFLKGDGKTRESYAECDDCFEKNIRKMTLKCIKESIHAKGLDMCPECGLRGKHAPTSVKQCLRFYKCKNGHEWKLIDVPEEKKDGI